jgi:TatD DNase family protein
LITDSHTHLTWHDYASDLDAVLARAQEAGVTRMLVVGTNLDTSRQCIELCRRHGELFPTVGIHPHDAAGVGQQDLAELAELCALDECVAVGETGLDFFKEYSPRADQERLFHAHLELALKLDKPVIIHCRDAHPATAEIIAEHPGVRGVMHCYSMGPEELPVYTEAGLHISFSGALTYPANEANREAARAVPAQLLLAETDCPFLAPQGRRGKRNEPAFVAAVVDELARLRGLSPSELAVLTSENATRLFNLG